ncbi:MAG: diaminopimelate epimerase [Heliobacteriaceae bacterium]|nr:diaminopimelate epimerase [Heliobacteriaceae bacterium]MDD4586971.1 diaminopimelate epimerase [Heliobacteriaceae bacterium]
MEFVKMHGLGNDFIVVDARRLSIGPDDWESVARRACDRHFGIGADGLILVFSTDEADIRWRILNPDGSEPEMCGNGIRCFARYVFESGIVNKPQMTVETLAGIIVPEILFRDGTFWGVRVDMGKPRLQRTRIPMTGPAGMVISEQLAVGDQLLQITAVSMGNPHCLVYVDDVETAPVTELGSLLEKHPVFPQKTNVEFVQVLSPQAIKMRVWERGAGLTLACGTGACAAVVGSVLNRYTERRVTVHLPGGALEIEWDKAGERVFMTGPAVEVFRGEYSL